MCIRSLRNGCVGFFPTPYTYRKTGLAARLRPRNFHATLSCRMKVAGFITRAASVRIESGATLSRCW